LSRDPSGRLRPSGRSSPLKPKDIHELHVVVLAAGKGTRMKSAWPKVLHCIAGRPMIDYVLDTAAALKPRSTTVVVGHQAEAVKSALASRPGLTFVAQEPQAGTGHALLTTAPVLAGRKGTVVLLSGDVPLLRSTTLETLVGHHKKTAAAGTVVTAVVDDPAGYGRVVRGPGTGQGLAGIARIVEHKDASAEERGIREINSGIYAFQLEGLFDALRNIGSENAQGEYYLPDLVALYRQRGLVVETVTVLDSNEISGINSRAELAAVSFIVRQTRNVELMAAGVTIEDPATTYVDKEVTVGADTIIHPGVSLEGRTSIGEGCEIHSGSRLVNARIGDRVTVLNHCVITDAAVASGVQVGPFAHLHHGTRIAPGAKVGNFVEMKKTALGAGSKSMHLTYLGDAMIGAGVNIGAGTITCNYDGVAKHMTRIEDGAFVGSDTQLIAPVKVGKGAYVGTGTTVREDVPPGALAVSAGRQRNIEGWVEAKKRRAVKN
jgi:bifunctional UDP-N-acetylglucosamine pyrophosphorylase/glucosamine-1-phosphate N-acetyltransferase